MYETRAVTITLQLPHDIADQAEELHAAEPEFLERVVLYGLTRRSIYRQLRERKAGSEHRSEVMGGVPVVPIEESEGRRILAENRHHDGGAWADKAGR